MGGEKGNRQDTDRTGTSRPIGPTDPAFSRNPKPPPLGGGVFTEFRKSVPCVQTATGRRSDARRAGQCLSLPTMSDAPLTPEQVKAARELLGWSQMDVANRVGLTEWVIGFFERGERLIRARYLRRMRSIFEAAGVIFVEENGEGPGVRLRKRIE